MTKVRGKEVLTDEQRAYNKRKSAFRKAINYVIKRDGLAYAEKMKEYFHDKDETEIPVTLGHIGITKSTALEIIQTCIDSHILRLQMDIKMRAK